MKKQAIEIKRKKNRKHMKSILAIFLLNSLFSFEQSEDCSFYTDLDNEKVYTEVTKEANPIIRETHISSYFLNHLNLDSQVLDEITSSKTVVKVIISSEGVLLKKEVLKEGIPGVSAQMFELMEKIKWEPALCGTSPVASEVIIPCQVCLK